MLKIKADRMCELERYGFEKSNSEKGGYDYYHKIFRSREKALLVEVVVSTGDIYCWNKRYLENNEIEIKKIMHRLFEADMVEEVAE